MTEIQIRIAEDFSKYPLGRDDGDGVFNGEKFRKEFLVPALNSSSKVNVYLDGPRGYGSSFLEEAFGGLVRKEDFTISNLKKILTISYDKPLYEIYSREAWEYIEEATPQ